MAGADATKHFEKNVMSKDLISTLAHHDAAISTLGGRMTGVEAGLTSLQSEVSDLDHKVGDGFAQLSSLVRENQAGKGPGMAEVLKVVATGGAVLAMSATAITVLVTSFTAPQLTKLESKADGLERDNDARLEAERNELQRLREQRRDRLETKLDELMGEVSGLKEKYQWSARVEPTGGKR